MDELTLPKYILYQYSNFDITHLKLQKLLYYVKVWGIIAGENLYDGEFSKWKYGPVNETVYQEYKSYGKDILPTSKATDLAVDDKAKQITDFILDVYSSYPALSLSAMTHREKPWQETNENEIIDTQKIVDYYATVPFAKNFNPFDPATKPFYPVQSDFWCSFTMDMTAEDIQLTSQYASYEIYKEQMEKAQKETRQLLQKLRSNVSK